MELAQYRPAACPAATGVGPVSVNGNKCWMGLQYGSCWEWVPGHGLGLCEKHANELRESTNAPV